MLILRDPFLKTWERFVASWSTSRMLLRPEARVLHKSSTQEFYTRVLHKHWNDDKTIEYQLFLHSSFSHPFRYTHYIFPSPSQLSASNTVAIPVKTNTHFVVVNQHKFARRHVYCVLRCPQSMSLGSEFAPLLLTFRWVLKTENCEFCCNLMKV